MKNLSTEESCAGSLELIFSCKNIFLLSGRVLYDLTLFFLTVVIKWELGFELVWE